MLKRSYSVYRNRSKAREEGFLLDCTNQTASKYTSYNPLKDKFLKYIVPCPCNLFMIKKCKNKKLKLCLTENNEITLENDSPKANKKAEYPACANEVGLGKIVKNIKR